MMTEPDTSDARYNYIYRGTVNMVGQSQRGCLVFLQSRDSQLHHANVPCLDDSSGVLGELHDHSVGGLYPIGACDVQVIVVGPVKIGPISMLKPSFL